MRRLSIALISAVSVIALTQTASAAPPPPVYNWSGFYIGVNVGYSWGDARTDVAGSGTIFGLPNFPVLGDPGFPTSIGFSDSNRARLDGVIGGGQIGYNYQFSPKWVLGLEADIQGSGERGSNTFIDPFSTQVCDGASFPHNCDHTSPLNGTAVTDYEAKIKWFGTVRGRLGFLVTDQVLLYATGGLAYGQVEVSGNTNVSSALFFPKFGAFVPLGPSGATFSASKTNVGFSVGGGIEGSAWLPANWTWKLEYLYLDLGSLDVMTSFSESPNLDTTPLTGSITTHTHFTDNIVRVGLNYKFH